MKTKKPATYSAAAVAAAISRRLRKAGLLIADTTDRYAWTEGIHVSRVGCSTSVSISYHVHHDDRSVEGRQRYREAIDKARELLLEAGYQFDPKMNGLLYIKCERE